MTTTQFNYDNLLNKHEELINKHEELINKHEELINKYEELNKKYEELNKKYEENNKLLDQIKKLSDENMEKQEKINILNKKINDLNDLGANIEISTLKIKEIINLIYKTQNSYEIKKINNFLNQKPLYTNYLIKNFRPLIGKCYLYADELLDKPLGPSEFNFNEHINLEKLNYRCKLTLSPQQYYIIKDYI